MMCDHARQRLHPCPCFPSAGYAAPINSESKFAVRAEPDELQHIVANASINQHEVRPDMAVAVVLPFARQRVIAPSGWER